LKDLKAGFHPTQVTQRTQRTLLRQRNATYSTYSSLTRSLCLQLSCVTCV